MISGAINNLGIMLLHHVHDDIKESRMDSSPLILRVFQLPSVDYISIHNQTVTVHGRKKLSDFLNLGMSGSDMDIGNDNCFKMRAFHLFSSYTRIGKSSLEHRLRIINIPTVDNKRLFH